MPLYRPQELRRFLDELGVAPKKALSQNFLIDGNIVNKIVEAAEISPGDQVLEIGPGPGVLTERLLEAGAHVTAVERDTMFAQALGRLDPSGDRLRVIEADVLTIQPDQLFSTEGVKLVANLPYQITSPIFAKFLPLFPLFSRIVVMIQDEVARRVTAQVGTSDYSHLTLLVDAYSDSRYVTKVSPKSFYPPPKVSSAVVDLKLKAPPLKHMDGLWAVTRLAFQHRRKMLRASLRSLHAPAETMRALNSCGFDETQRPEQLSIQDFVALYEELNK